MRIVAEDRELHGDEDKEEHQFSGESERGEGHVSQHRQTQNRLRVVNYEIDGPLPLPRNVARSNRRKRNAEQDAVEIRTKNQSSGRRSSRSRSRSRNSGSG